MKKSFIRTTSISVAIGMVFCVGPVTMGYAIPPIGEILESPTAATPTDAATPEVSTPDAAVSQAPTAADKPAAQAVSARGDVSRKAKLTAKQRKIAKARVVWGFAAIGDKGAVRGGKVTVRSIRNKPLKAEVLTKKTNKHGFYAVSRLGLPKRFVVAVTGGKVPVKSGKKTVWKPTNATLLTAVGKPKKGYARHTAADVTLGTTVAALTGVKKYRNAGDARAAARTRKAMRLPAHAKLGVYDRLMPHYVTAKKVRAKAQAKGSLTKLINSLVKRASASSGIGTGLGEGKRTKFRIRAGSNNTQRATTASLRSTPPPSEVLMFGAETYEVASAGYEIYEQALSLFGVGGESESEQLAQIEQQLTQISSQLSTIQTQLSTLQDEMQTEFAALSLQVSQTRYDLLATSASSLVAQANYAMQQMQYLSQVATPALSFLMPAQLSDIKGLLANLSSNAASTQLQQELVGGSGTSSSLIGSLWDLIAQQRATQAPAASASTPASTTLLTHETYDAFNPTVAQWYLGQVQLAILMTNYTMIQDLGSDDPLVMSNGQFNLSPTAQAIYNYSMNGICNASPAPCPGSYNSYLNVLSTSIPKSNVGALTAVDTSTGLMWGHFGVVKWNTTETQPSASSPDLNLPPTVTVNCQGQSQVLHLDTDFFATVNGTDAGCQWPDAPVGGPEGSNEDASDWQMLSADEGTLGRYDTTLGSNLQANMHTAGTGLLAQIDNSTQLQNANPSKNVPGVNAMDFTSPSLFPDTGWGRLVYSKGAWNQFMWSSDVPDYDLRFPNVPLFKEQTDWEWLLAPRNPAGNFLAFDILNPSAPSMTSNRFSTGCSTDPSTVGGLANYQYCTNWIWPSLYAEVPWPGSTPYEAPSDGATFQKELDTSTNGIAGIASPWWPLANLSRSGNLNSSLPATPGCANYVVAGYYGRDAVESMKLYDTCSASVIGTRQVTVSDYEWQQPASIG